MADIDLYRDAYRTKLGREASDDELQGWASGAFGGGSVQDRLNQIANSGEAQARNQTPTSYTPPVVDVGQNPNVSTPQTPATPQWGGLDPQFASSLNNAYSMYLGRSASPQELQNWFSGQYGYGSGASGLGAFTEAIRNSGEARSRNNGQTPTTQYFGTDYWGTQGVNSTDMFDTATGQLKPGWERYGSGYRRIGGGGPTGGSNVPGPQGGDFQSWFMQLTGGKPPTPELLESLAPTLAQYGIRLGSKGNRGWTDTIILPDGRMFDVIEAAGIGTGKSWTWQQNGGPGYTPQGVGGGPLPGNQFNDPYTMLLEQLIKSRLGMLQGGINDPMRQQYMGGLQNRANALGAAAEPEYQALIQRLEGRFKDLQGPGYTGAENEAVRTGALDPIEQDRAAAKQRVMERLSARGLDLNSGIAQQALNEVDKAFDGMRATTQTTLTTNDLNRRESRNQRADQIKGTLYDIPQARAREQLDVFSAMEILENAMRQEEQANSREAIGYGGALADLGPQRMQLAMQAAGMGGNPASMFNSLYQMMSMNQNAALLSQRNSGAFWSGLGSVAADLMNAGR